MHITFLLRSWRETVDRLRIGTDNIRVSPHHSVDRRAMQTLRGKVCPSRQGIWYSISVSYEGSGDILMRREKLIPRYIGSLKVRLKVGKVAYRLVLPSEVSRIHPVFHILMLKRYISDPSCTLQLQAIKINKNLTNEEYPVATVGRQVC